MESKIRKYICAACGKDFLSYEKHRKYCSKGCFGISCHNKIVTIETRKKQSLAQKGQKSHRWKGGRSLKTRKYKLIKHQGHPYKNTKGFVYEHRLVMENHIGRFLHPNEVVHHINGDASDNRIENLKLFKNNSEHTKHHIDSYP